jgi:hypothetical protein
MSHFDRVQVEEDPPRTYLGAGPESRPDSSPATTSAGSRGRRRRRARDDADAEPADARPGESMVAVHSDGHGGLEVRIDGPVDRTRAHRIGALLQDLRPNRSGRLLIDLTRLGSWDSHLVRVLGRVRIQHIIGGGQLELRDAPTALVAALDRPPADPTSERTSAPAVQVTRTAAGGEPTGGPPEAIAPPADHDGNAQLRRTRRLISDIDRVGALAAQHGDADPDWRAVTVLLERARATLARDLLQPRAWQPTGAPADRQVSDLHR